MLFITILSGSFLPIFTPQKAEAYLDDNFNIPEVKVISVGATTAVLQFQLQVNGGNDGNIGHDIYKGRIPPNGSTNGITGWTYIEGQDGNPIYEVLSGQSNSSQGNEEIPGNGGALGSYDPLECNGYGCGVYLDIATNEDNLGTMAKKEAATLSDEEVINGKILDRAGKPIPGITFDQNIGQSIVVIPDIFLGTQTINITVTGLKPDTQYVSQGRLEETCSVIPLIRNCIGELSNDTLSALSDDEEKIAPFKTLPAGSPEVTTSPTGGQNIVEGSTDTGNPGNLPYCLDFSLTSGRAAINMLGCFTQLVYYVLYIPTAALARLAAGFLDWFLHFSLQSSSYTATEFVPQGWRIVRDISNILFIFVLLYIAIGTILRISGVDAKKMIASLVVVALLINFSLFFTKIIIDTSNILARIMYDSVNVTGQSSSVGGEKSITLGLVSKFNPQKIFKTSDIDANANTGWFFFVLLIAIAINIFMFLMFLKVAVLFLGRVIGLMVSMILSPFAFVSWIVPSMKGWMKIGWTNWWHELVSQAFMAPIFLFFLYIIIMATDLKLLPIAASNSPTGGSLESNIQGLIGLIIPFAIIYFLIKTAVDMAVKLSGDIGAASLAVMNKVGGAAVGVATGGAALGLRSTLGAVAAARAKDPDLQRRAAEGDKWAQRQLTISNSMAASSFDFRKTKAGEGFAKQTGWDTKASSGLGGFAQGAANLTLGTGRIDLSTEGGAKGATERKKDARMKEAETYKMSGYEADQQNKKAKDWQERYETDKENARAALGDKFKEADFKKLYEKQMATIYDKDGNITHNGNGGGAKVQSAAEVNAQRMRDSADTIEYGPGYVSAKNAARTANEQQVAEEIAAGVAAGSRTAAFSEEKWREAETISKRNLNATEKATISSLRKQAGEETKDAQKPISITERRRAQQTLDKAAREMAEVNDHLKDIADNIEFETGVRPPVVDESHIKQVVEYRQKDLATAQANLTIAEASKNPIEIAKAHMNIEKAKEDIKMYKEVFAKKDTVEQKTRDANDKLNS